MTQLFAAESTVDIIDEGTHDHYDRSAKFILSDLRRSLGYTR